MANWRIALKQLTARPLSAPLVLMALSLVSYGLYLSWMGFYWDDWPVAWISHISDSFGIRYFQFQRPLSGWVISLAAFVIDEIPIRWQMLTLGLRFASGLAVWWLIKTIWTQYRTGALLIAALFLVFPGFSQQFVSVNSAPHLVALILFTLSLVFMVQAERQRPPSWSLRALSITTAFVSMMTTDYYYGLELSRPLMIWLSWDKERKNFRDLLKSWLPYLTLVIAIFIWRRYISQFGAYSLSLLENVQAAPIYTLQELARTMLRDLVTATLGVWASIFSFPRASVVGAAALRYYWLLVFACAAGLAVFLVFSRREASNRRWGGELVVLGVTGLLSGGIAFWVPGLPFKMAFPSDRLMLPMMLGSVLLLAGLIELVRRPTLARAIFFPVLIGLAVGSHFFNAISYRIDWEKQRSFYNQLIWRIPGLAPGTTLVSEELPFEYVTDNSLTGAINWIYAPEFYANPAYYDWEYRIEPFISLPYMLRYLDLRLGWQLPPLEEAAEYEAPYRFFRFRGSSGEVLLLHYEPDVCLRVFDPIFDEGNPQLAEISELAAYALSYTDVDLILTNPDQTARLPREVLGPGLPAGWCYYFEQAELARQKRDWVEIARLGDIAFEEYGGPKHASELAVFVEGYAMSGEWDSAESITEQAVELDASIGAMLCATWERIENALSPSDAQALAGEQLSQLNCQ